MYCSGILSSFPCQAGVFNWLSCPTEDTWLKGVPRWHQEKEGFQPGTGKVGCQWPPWPGWAMPELRPAAQMSQEKLRWAFALPAWHGCTMRQERAVLWRYWAANPQPHPQGSSWRSVRPVLPWVSAAPPAALEVSGAFSRAATSHLEWLLVLCAHTSLILQLSLPCTALIPALSTSLLTEHLSAVRASPALSGCCCCVHRPAYGELVSCKGAMNFQLCRCLQGTMCDPVAATLPVVRVQHCPSSMQDSTAAHMNDALLSTPAATALEGCAVCRNCHSSHKKPNPIYWKCTNFLLKLILHARQQHLWSVHLD